MPTPSAYPDPGLVFEKRLDAHSPRPIAVAISGGADSLLALIETVAWARAHGRRVLALSVDHGLQPSSRAWTSEAGEMAKRLGCDFTALAWAGPKPEVGLPAAARDARHGLLAQAARQAGARVIVTGHTGDDALENLSLRLGPLYQWSPSPIWPQGRGLMLLRPLLGLRREAIRTRLKADGRDWIDDPANHDPAHPRVLARRRIAGQGEPPPPAELAPLAALAQSAQLTAHSILFSRAVLAAASSIIASRVLAAAAVSAGGGPGAVRRDRLDRLTSRLNAQDVFTATLAGARIEAERDQVLITREAGDMRRRPPSTTDGVWDGRYHIARIDGDIRPLAGLAARLPLEQKRALAALPAAVRPSLPAIVAEDGVTCPLLAPNTAQEVQALVPGRFKAACGVYAHERELEL